MHRVWLISDLQVPFHDRRAVDAVAQAIADLKGPNDIVATVGDEIDLQTISRWSVNSAKEWERSIGRDRDLTVEVLRDLQVQHCVRSNHTDRLWKKLSSNAPGFLGLPELELPNFLRFDELGITFHPKDFRVAPGWRVLHGDEGSISRQGGGTAAALSARVGSSIACGHTHRMGLRPTTQGIYGHIERTLWGMEVGCLMDFKSTGAAYSRIHDWQQGIGLLYVDKGRVTPVPVPIINRSFVIEGEQYSW